MEITNEHILDEIRRLEIEGSGLNTELESCNRTIKGAISRKDQIAIMISDNMKKRQILLKKANGEEIEEGFGAFSRKMKEIGIENYQRNKEHFTQRIKERYNLDVTNIEYTELCYKKFKHIFYRLSSTVTFGVLEIQGVDVWVIKDKRSKSLRTCLIVGTELPIPGKYRRYGISREQFNERFNRELEKVKQLIKQIDDEGGDFMSFKYDKRDLIQRTLMNQAHTMVKASKSPDPNPHISINTYFIEHLYSIEELNEMPYREKLNKLDVQEID